VLDDVAALAESVLVACPATSLLATSREGIGIDGEHLYAVRPLAVPADDTSASPAIELFAERASAADADFEITGANRRSVAAVCRRLDGIPLAIELAAARLRSMSVADIEAHLDERFTLLNSGRRSLKRHQTLAAAIDWSYQLLDDAERRVLGRLAVFAGSFTRDAVERVASGEDVLPKVAAMVLDQLVEKSLVARDLTGTETRYRLLETIREYAIDKLRSVDDDGAVRLAHARYYTGLAEAADATIRGPGEQLAIVTIQAELDNLRAAFEHAVAVGEIDLAARLAVSVIWEAFCVMDIEHYSWGHRLVDTGIDHPLRCRLLGAAMHYSAWHQIDGAACVAHAREVIDANEPDRETLAWAHSWIGLSAQLGLGSQLVTPAVEALRELLSSEPDVLVAALVANVLMWLDAWVGDRERVAPDLDRYLAIASRGRSPHLWNMARCGAATVIEASDPARATELARQVLETPNCSGSAQGLAHQVLAGSLPSLGRPGEALTYAVMSWRWHDSVGAKTNVVSIVEQAGHALTELGALEWAMRTYGAAAALMPDGYVGGLLQSEQRHADLDRGRAMLGDQAVEQLLAEGREIDVHDLLDRIEALAVELSESSEAVAE
jgi:predicted ATPase